MDVTELRGRDLVCTQDWAVDELEAVLDLAARMKARRYSDEDAEILRHRTFMMMFYNSSLRTRQSFEAAASELGGHAQFLEPSKLRIKTKTSSGEVLRDTAKVMSRYACGIGIRILEDSVEAYGDGDAFLREFAELADVPVVSMAHDKFHPCQGLADVLGMRERLGDTRGKTLLQIWGYSPMVRSWSSVQESLLVNSRLGMNVRLAFPEGYDLDPDVIGRTKANCDAAGVDFEITHEQEEAYDGVDVVYSRHWMHPDRYRIGREGDQKLAAENRDWRTTMERMSRTNDAVFVHPMPVDRGNEVDDDVCDSERSLLYDIAENRLHVQKAIMALTMAG
ncbi:MAG: ornithine carbamoyltransferase [Candidatus Eisenbacteria bacterium]|nr:ornithine carbamoyltransferase [Candidatus Eisenbacteria bacterium]